MALVVTIVVLLILAGVSLNLVLGNSGIISKSNEAKEKYSEAKANEESDLESAVDWIDAMLSGESMPAKAEVNVKATANSTINGKKGSSNNPVIPEGYIPIDTATSSWGDGSSTPDVANGLVIADESGNEWVWVPVEDVSVMCDTSNKIEYPLCGTDTITTKFYSKPIAIKNSSENSATTNPYEEESLEAASRSIPGTTDDFREPDLVTYYDTAEKYQTILGFNSTEDMAKAFKEDYEEMIKSVKTYGGFYIGRYELSEEGVQKDKETLTKTNWYNLYKKCKELNASEKVETRMIWGCQWDVTCNYIANKGDKKDVWDSSTWGNYYDTSVKADDGETEIKASGTETKLNTGVTTFTMANNIYDLAGNCVEWTQEAQAHYGRVVRGGNCDDNGSSYPASYRSSYRPNYDGDSYLRVSSHFNNKVALSARA